MGTARAGSAAQVLQAERRASRERQRARSASKDYGSLYVVEFGNGVLKVGRSQNPTSRMATYELQAAIHDNPVINSHLTPKIGGLKATEGELIRLVAFWIKRNGGTQYGKEWFRPPDHLRHTAFTECVELAKRAMRREGLCVL